MASISRGTKQGLHLTITPLPSISPLQLHVWGRISSCLTGTEAALVNINGVPLGRIWFVKHDYNGVCPNLCWTRGDVGGSSHGVSQIVGLRKASSHWLGQDHSGCHEGKPLVGGRKKS